MTTAIIGAGEMGTWFARQDRKQGIEVILADSDIPKARDASREIGARFGEVGEAIRAADKVMLAASLGANEDIIDEYSTDLREKTVLDISSVKNGITGKLRMLGPKTYSIHPMWGGDTSDDLKGRNLISIPLHSLEDPAYARFLGKEEEIFRRQGANVRRVADEREHDILMAETLAAYHFGAMVMGATVSGNGLGFREHFGLIGTTATLADVSIGSVVHQNPRLYAEIQMRNPYFPAVMDRFIEKAKTLRAHVLEGNREGFTAYMMATSDYFRDGRDPKEYRAAEKGKFMAAVDAIRTKR